jgi:Zn-dependent protease
MNIGPDFIPIMIIVLLSITVHEFAHAKSADLAGDPTPRLHGRVTLNPVKHFDPAGLLMIFFTSLAGFGVGWGKACPVDPRRMHNPRWDDLLVSFWGPFSNILIALVCAVILRFAGLDGYPAKLILLALEINVGLAFFNLIPLFPLDGSWIAKDILPPRVGWDFYMWNRRYGVFILLACLFVLPFLRVYPLDYFLWPAVNAAVRVLVGV